MELAYRIMNKSDSKYVTCLVKNNLMEVIEKSFKGKFDFNLFIQRIRKEGNGYIIVFRGFRCGFIWFSIKGETLHINTIVIDEAYQGMGIGKRVFKDMDDFGKRLNLKYIHLGVQGINEKAKRFYEKIGFEYTGYVDEFDTYYMRKKLS